MKNPKQSFRETSTKTRIIDILTYRFNPVIREALEMLITMIMKHDVLTGDQVREIVDKFAHRDDLDRREAEKSEFL